MASKNKKKLSLADLSKLDIQTIEPVEIKVEENNIENTTLAVGCWVKKLTGSQWGVKSYVARVTEIEVWEGHWAKGYVSLSNSLSQTSLTEGEVGLHLSVFEKKPETYSIVSEQEAMEILKSNEFELKLIRDLLVDSMLQHAIGSGSCAEGGKKGGSSPDDGRSAFGCRWDG